MITVGSSACVPESSIVIVLACAGDHQIMLNASAKKKGSRTFVSATRIMAQPRS
jgi:hypothetical protein